MLRYIRELFYCLLKEDLYPFCIKTDSVKLFHSSTLESLELLMTQLSRYSWVALFHEFTTSTGTN